MFQKLYITSCFVSAVFSAAQRGSSTLFSTTNPSYKRKGSWLRGYWDEWNPSSHEERIVIDAATLARLAYRRHDWTPRKLDGDGQLSFIHEFNVHSSSYGFTGAVRAKENNANYAVVSFRGSTTQDDWKDDFNFPLAADNIHQGFRARIKASFPTWLTLLNTYKTWPGQDYRDILFTGHSLGAAEASVAAVWLHRARHSLHFCQQEYGSQAMDIHLKAIMVFRNTRLHVVNFASPRAGGKQFAAEHARAVTFFRRIVNAGDGVTNLPPYAFGLYAHAGEGMLMYAGVVFGSGISFARCKQEAFCGMSKNQYGEAQTAGLAGSTFIHGTHFHDMNLYLKRTKLIFRTN